MNIQMTISSTVSLPQKLRSWVRTNTSLKPFPWPTHADITFLLCHSQVTFLYIANFPKLKLTHDSLIYTCSGSNVKVKWDYQEERAHAPLTKREHECVLFAFISTEAGGESGPRPRKQALDAKIKNADWLTQVVKRGRDREEMIRPGEPH